MYYLHWNREFTTLASDLVNICHKKNEGITQELLTTNLDQFGSQSPMITALETDNLKFTSQIACQESVAYVWKGDLDSKTPHKKVGLFFILSLILHQASYEEKRKYMQLMNIILKKKQ